MNNKQWDALYFNASLATCETGAPYGLLHNAAIALKAGQIAWIGLMSELPEQYSCTEEVDLKGRLVTPGLIDCHTHLVYAGNRSNEFELRLQGASYEQIARAGGGIKSTVEATRLASDDELFQQSL